MTPTVLVGEDEPFFQEAVQWVLQSHGVNVILARDGDAVIASLRRDKPDLLLLDLVMPGTDGFAVLEHMRREGIKVPTIVLSNLSEDIDTETCAALGVRRHCVKSDMDIDDLWPVVRECLPASLATS